MSDATPTNHPDTPVNTTAPSPFQQCPQCGSASVMRLIPDWSGLPIPIVGCGNPWHYTDPVGRPMSDRPTDPGHPYGIMDAPTWAREFVRIFPSGTVDLGTLIGWFSNAIMTGYDKAKNDDEGRMTLVGHRTDDAHDCRLTNCRGLGAEVARMREQLIVADDAVDGIMRANQQLADRVKEKDAALRAIREFQPGPSVVSDTTEFTIEPTPGVHIGPIPGYVVNISIMEVPKE